MAPTQTESYLAVGVDGSAASLAALDWAAEEAARHHWPLRLVHAYDEAFPVHRKVPTEPIGREAAETVFSEARERLAARGHADLTVSTVADEGSPRRVLLRPDLAAHTVVVGRRGAGQFADLSLGSTALACAAHARVPVVVVPETWQPSTRAQQVITLGVDGSPRSHSAIEYAFAVASHRQAEIVAVFALQRPVPVLAPTTTTTDPDAHTEAAHMLAEQLAPWRAKFPDIAVREVVADGHPVAVIKEQSADADLVVVGGRGHGVVTGLLLGSIAQAVLTHVDRPVAVVHEPKGAADDGPAA